MLRTVSTFLLGCLLVVLAGCCVPRGGASLSEVCDSCTVCGTTDCVAHACETSDTLRGSLGRLRGQLTCGSGCSQFYFDEWINDPPYCCDPCDDCGNWVGTDGGCSCASRALHRGNLWGTRLVGTPASAHELPYEEGMLIDEPWTEEVEPELDGPEVLFSPAGYSAATAPRTSPRTTLRQARGE